MVCSVLCTLIYLKLSSSYSEEVKVVHCSLNLHGGGDVMEVYAMLDPLFNDFFYDEFALRYPASSTQATHVSSNAV